jgi:uracil-DNA glycosylase
MARLMRRAPENLRRQLPQSWRLLLEEELEKPYFARLERFLEKERKKHEVYPPADQVFTALELTPYEKVNVLLLGQDPYHDAGQAHGLCFSVQPGTKPPPSLTNIFKELQADLGYPIPESGCLVPWAKQGILLLNTILTVRSHQPHSHQGRGWEELTDAILRKLNEKLDPMVFVLWGGCAQAKLRLIDEDRHTVIAGAHPSPLSARYWFGSRPFSKINAALKRFGKPEIDWRLPAA